MIKDIQIFHNEEELLKLTGLTTDDELWDNGFTVEDWNGGIRVRKEQRLIPNEAPLEDYELTDDEWETDGTEYYEKKYHYKEAPINKEENVDYTIEEQIEKALEDFCVGYDVTVFGDYVYYIMHHS